MKNLKANTFRMLARLCKHKGKKGHWIISPYLFVAFSISSPSKCIMNIYLYLSNNALIGFFALHTFHCVLYSCKSQRGILQEEKGQILLYLAAVHMGLTPPRLVAFLERNNTASESRP